MPKTRLQKKIDAKLIAKSSGTGAPSSGAATPDIAPPAPPSIAAPDNLSLSTSIGSSTAAPTAIISATWDAPPGTIPQGYVVQASTGSGFAAAATITLNTIVRSVAIENLRPGTVYYVRVAARVQGYQGGWSDTQSITSATDTVAAGVPSSISATWIGAGDLLVTWTNPTEANFKDVQIVIRASSGGTIYRTTYSAAGRFLYTLAMNYADTAGAGDPSLYVELKSRTFSNVFGTTANTGLVTKTAPATPTGLAQSWSGDTGTAGADWTITWTRAEDAYRYRLAIDGANRQLSGNADTYTYTIDLSRSEHSGTPDPVLSYSLVAVDGFGQVSAAVSGTATNAAPAAPTATLTTGVVSGLYASVTSTPAADFWRYEYVFKRDGSTVATVYSAASSYRYEQQGAGDDGYHSWTVVIRQEDLFAQFSSTVTPAAVAFEALTLSGLRAQAAYTDSDGNTAVTLAALKDGITASGGVSYAA